MYKLSICNGCLNEMKVIFCLSRIFGVSPVSFVRSPMNAEESVETKPSRNIVGSLCSVAVFCAMALGFILSVADCIIYDIHDAGELLHHIVSHPMLYLSAGVSIVTHFTINRCKIAELLQELSSINKALIEKQKKYFVCVEHRNTRSGVIVLVTVFFLHLIFICLDIFLQARDLSKDVLGVNLRVAHWVNFIIMVQFCKLVSCIKFTLRELTRVISVNTDGDSVHYSVKRAFKSRQPFVRRSVSRSAVHIELIKESLPFHSDFRHRTAGEALSMHHAMFCRHIYSDIYDAHNLVNSIYGIPILLGFILNVTFSITNVCHILKSPDVSFVTISRLKRIATLIFEVLRLFVCVAEAFYVTVSCHLVTLESNKLNEKIQKLLLLNYLQKDSVKQLKLFSDQISKNCIKFTAFWFFTIDMSLFCAYVATTITYTIVLVQFK
jgi:hypothetical protein